METSAYKSHLPLAIVTVVLVVAMILLFKEVGALKTSLATLSTSLKNLSAADPVVTFVPVSGDTDTKRENDDGQGEIEKTHPLLNHLTTIEELPAPSSTKKKAGAAAR